MSFGAITDWLNVSFPFSPSLTAVDSFLQAFEQTTGGKFGGVKDRERGLHGYTNSLIFERGGLVFAFGGQRNTGFISFPGDACAFVKDWQKLIELFRDHLHGRITRWDGAVDDYFGQHSVDMAVELYLLEGFNNGGNRPSCSQRGNWIEPDGSGRTFYVGKRKNGKLARIYEKGMQLGARNHPWVRWEIELHRVDREIPWEVLISPGAFLAGAYPCMHWVHGNALRIPTIAAQDSITYDRLIQAGSMAYGGLIEIMLAREGSPDRVVDQLRRAKVPRRLEFTDDFLRYGEESE